MPCQLVVFQIRSFAEQFLQFRRILEKNSCLNIDPILLALVFLSKTGKL